MQLDLRSHIRSIPDFPKPGVVFRDITTLLEQPDLLRAAADQLVDCCGNAHIDKVVVVESRGFLLGGILAYLIRAGLVVVRKKGKLPDVTRSKEYGLEYGRDTIEIHEDSIRPGERVWLHDDLIATGGTIVATAELVQSCGAEVVGASFLIGLEFLGGREKLLNAGVPQVHALVCYDSE